MKKSVPPKGLSPSVSKKAKSGFKYGTGPDGRAKPSGCDKVGTTRGNPPQGKRGSKRGY